MPVHQVKETYKDIISAEIQNLSESEMEKVVKMIHFLKVEFLSKKEKTSEEAFKKARGAWGDVNIEKIHKKLDEAWKPQGFRLFMRKKEQLDLYSVSRYK